MTFWQEIDQQLERLRTARTPAQVVKILNDPQYTEIRAYAEPTGDAFWAGGGGDYTPIDPLTGDAGWKVAWFKARYWYALEAPEGGFLEYVEGDIYAHDKRPRPGGE